MPSLFERLFFKPSLLNILRFLIIWPTLALSLGLSTLVVPLYWLTSSFQGSGSTQRAEDIAVQILIALLALATFILAVWLTRLSSKGKKWYEQWMIPFLSLLSGAGAVWLMLNPQHFDAVASNISVYNAQFAFGGYPTPDLLKQLKRDGYQGIISALDPEHIPLEKVLWEKEQKMAADVGLELTLLPLLPWVGSEENQKSIDQLIHIAKTSRKRYFIHCYLGRDRTGLIQRALEQVSPHTKLISLTNPRNLVYTRHVEHGPVIHLIDQVYLVPKLVEDELIGYVISSPIRNVAIIAADEQDQWAEKDEEYLNSYLVPYQKFFIPRYPYDPNKVLEVVKQTQQLARPLIIYVEDSASFRAQAFAQAFYTNLPPLSPLLFTVPLEGGPIKLLAVNATGGPRPQPQEFSYLRDRGIEKILYLGNPSSNIQEEIQTAEQAGLSWQPFQGDFKSLESFLKQGGSWYVYGPNLPLYNLSFLDSLQNGPIYRLNTNVFITPMPTPEEMASFTTGYVTRVFMLVDPKDPIDQLEQEKEALNQRGIEVEWIKIPETYDPDWVLKITQQVWSYSTPVVVQITDSRSYIVQAFRQAYLANVPPLPPLLFKDAEIEGMPINLAAPNIAVGPEPTKKDLNEDIYAKGIKKLLKIDLVASAEKRTDEIYTSDTSIQCSNSPSQSECVYRALSKGGPWYVYGPTPKAIQERLANRLGPAEPSVPLVYFQQSSSLLSSAPLLFNNLLYCDQCAQKLFPSLSLIVLLSPLLALYTLFSASFVGWLNRKEVKTHYTRKIFHILIFSLAGLLQVLLHFPAVLLFGIIASLALVYALFENQGFPLYDALVRPSDAQDQTVAIFFRLVSTALGALISYFLFGNFFIIGILVCGWGDAAAELIGRSGYHPYQSSSLIGEGSRRTIEGSTAMLVVSFIVTLPLLYFLFGLTLSSALIISLAVAVIATIVEALSGSRIDNLTIQIFASGIAYYLANWIGRIL